MLVLKKIAVTGGMAAGKSTVCQLLSNKGAYVVDCDKIVAELLQSDSPVAPQIIQLLGALFTSSGKVSASREGSGGAVCDEGIAVAIAEKQNTPDDPLAGDRKPAEEVNKALLGPLHSFDKKQIASKVFANKSLLKSLENILHPLVFKKLEESYREACEQKNYTAFVAEVPLLFEVGWEKWFDLVVVVAADIETMKKRYESKMHSADFDMRLQNQFPLSKKIERADYVIYNQGSLEQLKSQVNKISL